MAEALSAQPLSPVEVLRETMRERVRYPQLCAQSLSWVLTEDVLASTLLDEVSLDDDGASQWQELSVLTSEQLVVWIVGPPDPHHPLPQEQAAVEVQLRSVPLVHVREIAIARAYTPAGEFHGIHGEVSLGTQDRMLSGEDHAHVVYDSLHFTATGAGSPRLASMDAFLTRLARALH